MLTYNKKVAFTAFSQWRSAKIFDKDTKKILSRFSPAKKVTCWGKCFNRVRRIFKRSNEKERNRSDPEV